MDETYGINAEHDAWIGLDPGVTTGWALIDHNGSLIGSGSFSEETLRDGLDEMIRGCHRARRELRVAIEKMPPGAAGRLSDRLTAVRETIREVIEEVYDLPVFRATPGEWKNSRVAKIVRWPESFESDHARDAATLALYVKDRERRHALR